MARPGRRGRGRVTGAAGGGHGASHSNGQRRRTSAVPGRGSLAPGPDSESSRSVTGPTEQIKLRVTESGPGGLC